MKTVNCPLCNAPLKLVLSHENFYGWKECGSCGQPSYLAVNRDGDVAVASLRGMIEKVTSKRQGVDMLELLLRKDVVSRDDILFQAGKIVETDLEFLSSMHVLEQQGVNYAIKMNLKPFIQEQVQPLLQKPGIFTKTL